MSNMDLWGVVDMGSNGIRFSINDLSPKSARILPSLYQDRLGISLFDAQWKGTEKIPIPDETIQVIIKSLKRFKNICKDFNVPTNQVRVIATEATRVALNSTEFLDLIFKATEWKVQLLSKELEGRTGALGVISSFWSVHGLIMDLGGGSTQLGWINASNGNTKISETTVSLPYGAAALTKRLEEVGQTSESGSTMSDLTAEITQNLHKALQSIEIPKDILDQEKTKSGINLYLSGGGFRGWGFILMSLDNVKPYPIQIINGYTTSTNKFNNINLVTGAASDQEIFRISERRAGQVPAVALLVSCLQKALPSIGKVHFAQGGVREGILWPMLSIEQQGQHPLQTVTNKFATSSADAISDIIFQAFPKAEFENEGNGIFRKQIIQALAQSMFIHNIMNKDIQASAALRSTTSGILASVHGADHKDRAILAIMLCERWGGIDSLNPLDIDFYNQLVEILDSRNAWWAIFVGRVAAIVGEIYPVGKIENFPTVTIDSSIPKKGDIKLVFHIQGHDALSDNFQKSTKYLEKLSKKKNRPKNTQSWDVEVKVSSR